MDRILSTFVLLNTSTVLKDFIEQVRQNTSSQTLPYSFKDVSDCSIMLLLRFKTDRILFPVFGRKDAV